LTSCACGHTPANACRAGTIASCMAWIRQIRIVTVLLFLSKESETRLLMTV
jgi:hypothetical protein